MAAPTPDSVISLNGSFVSPRVNRVVGIVEGPDELRRGVKQSIERAFEKGGPMEQVVAGEEAEYVSRILADLSVDEQANPGVAAAIAIRIRGDVVLAAAGGATADLTGPGGEKVVQADSRAETPVVLRSGLGPANSIVLMGKGAAEKVSETEVLQTMRGSFSLEDAARWLTTLAGGRGAESATALITRMEPGKSHRPVKAQAKEVHHIDAPPRRARRSKPLRIAAVAVVAFAVVIGATAAGTTLLKSSTSALQFSRPTGLRVVVNQPSTQLLSWSAAPGATAYIVRISGRRYSTTAVNLHLGSALRPGQSYVWRVRARYGRHLSAWSGRRRLSVPLAHLSSPHALSPRGVIHLNAGAKVSFCWTGASASTRYRLFIGGTSQRFHLTIPAARLQHRSSGGLCTSKALAFGAYSYRVGASAPGHVNAWTLWQHFSVLSLVTPTPVPAVTNPPANTVPLVTPTVAAFGNANSNTTAPSSNTTAPSSNTTTNQSVTSSQNTSGAAPQQQPTSVVSSCSNPPNCG